MSDMTEQEGDAIVGRVFREHKAATEKLARVESELRRARSEIESFLSIDLNNLHVAKLPPCLEGAKLATLLEDYKTTFREVTRLASDLEKF
jgi:hypothetical protein